ncbi:RnfABCDGE type electron transport complex subunit B [Uliginosibacterium sp. 31-16]|uniref:RnfABCDGE type electron transport complex subunit B n=1 Tax=Uliginosibacterium sp. 31-16 TaxID=3068315 RepID=UPI00273FAFCE|nr:RnfABCDGE type electron transport complex subunit B [Uliginosibacterium sp. 31-16]MDP5238007.1 RnfABCDGE type electron transport complex subunit B [Uliginosibacterium sp. 31-16]
MLAAILSLTALGLTLGLGLGYTARVFAVEGNSLVSELADMMPGTNCGQCGLAGCGAAAEAVAGGTVPATVCPGGGVALAQAIAAKLGITLSLEGMEDKGPMVAEVAEDICIGCGKCMKHCATDAIVGAAKQIHGVLHEACTGCGGCMEDCPTGAIVLRPLPVTLRDWNWTKPALAA